MLCPRRLAPSALKGWLDPLPVTMSVSLFSFQDQLLQCHLCTGSFWWLQNVGERQRTVSVPVTARLPQDSGGCQSKALPCAHVCLPGSALPTGWAGLPSSLLSPLPHPHPHALRPAPSLSNPPAPSPPGAMQQVLEPPPEDRAGLGKQGGWALSAARMWPFCPLARSQDRPWGLGRFPRGVLRHAEPPSLSRRMLLHGFLLSDPLGSCAPSA